MSGDVDRAVQRVRWRVGGQVQGVGFRPFVHREACRFHLTGLVRNDPEGVVIEGQGSLPDLDAFEQALRTETPALARIDTLEAQVLPAVSERSFVIDSTRSAATATAQVTVDVAVCADCLRELEDPADRRHGYALTNCTNCGPRFSIVRSVPYDRPNTTMAGFPLCADCAAEYDDPVDRRFHAQPTACPVCGPRVRLLDPQGRERPGDPISNAAAGLDQGGIVALKGLGGFHLAVDATNDDAVARLRARKRRDAKPLALMAADLETARGLVELGERGEAALRSPRAPIVLGVRRPDAGVASAVAPGTHRLGVMLPYTPLHHLLFARLEARVLVLTSGNLSDEPLVIDDDEIVTRLGGLCDRILTHDRPIERRVDDSVLLDTHEGDPLPLRRSRGFAPERIALPGNEGPGLCVGADLKNVVAVVRPDEVILSQHHGDLGHPLANEAFHRSVRDLCELFSVRPEWIAHDLHPGYESTRAARELADAWDVPLVPVQHHHAHAAALCAESRADAMLAIVADGMGYGVDGTVWGGELLRVDGNGFERLAHGLPLSLPGGDRSAREPRRSALALLRAAGVDPTPGILAHLGWSPEEGDGLARQLDRGLGTVVSTGQGRWFDAVAALLGLCLWNHCEAEAAMALEAAAHGVVAPEMEPLIVVRDNTVDPAPFVRAWAADPARHDAPTWAALFHDHLADAWAEAARAASDTTGLRTVGLSGGCFANQRLSRRVQETLSAHGLHVVRHRLVPPGDGGIALGQAWVAHHSRAAVPVQEVPACV